MAISKNDFDKFLKSQFGDINDFFRGDIIIEGVKLGQHISHISTDITIEANGPVFDFEIGEYLFFVNKRGIVYSVEGPIPCFISNLYNYCWNSGCRAMDLIQLISELSNNVWEKDPFIDYDDNGEEITIWEQSSLIGPINSMGARVTITPNIESESGWKVDSITFELKGYENM